MTPRERARSPFDRQSIPPQIEQDGEVEDDTDTYDKEGKGRERRGGRKEDVSIPDHDLSRY